MLFTPKEGFAAENAAAIHYLIKDAIGREEHHRSPSPFQFSIDVAESGTWDLIVRSPSRIRWREQRLPIGIITEDHKQIELPLSSYLPDRIRYKIRINPTRRDSNGRRVPVQHADMIFAWLRPRMLKAGLKLINPQIRIEDARYVKKLKGREFRLGSVLVEGEATVEDAVALDEAYAIGVSGRSQFAGFNLLRIEGVSL